MTREVTAPPEELIRQACHDAGLGRVQRSRLCTSGIAHAVYRIETSAGLVAVRLGPGGTPGALWQQNPHLISLRVAPRLLSDQTLVCHRRKYRCAIWKWQSGRRFDPRRDLRRLADTLSKLHRQTQGLRIAPVTEPDTVRFLQKRIALSLDRGDQRSAVGGILCRAASNALTGQARGRRGRASFLCLVHNDLVQRNIIVKSNHVWLIDWDWALNASPVLDLCGFLSPFIRSWDAECMLSNRGGAIFLHRYLALFGRTDARAILSELSEAWDVYNAMVALWVFQSAGREQPHLRTREFYQRAFAGSEEFSNWLKLQLAT